MYKQGCHSIWKTRENEGRFSSLGKNHGTVLMLKSGKQIKRINGVFKTWVD